MWTQIVRQYGEPIQANCALLGKSIKLGTKVAFYMLINLWVRAISIFDRKSNMAAKFKMAAVITVIWFIVRAYKPQCA